MKKGTYVGYSFSEVEEIIKKETGLEVEIAIDEDDPACYSGYLEISGDMVPEEMIDEIIAKHEGKSRVLGLLVNKIGPCDTEPGIIFLVEQE